MSSKPNNGKFSPSRFLRELRPEYYSDTEDRVVYALDTALFEYHLDTLTSRNQTHDFEIFCRKLCERVVAPNLRGQTGPDGGGDSKADAETFPIADEIRALYYEGDPQASAEHWAFAFSTKQAWQAKIRSDVEGIVGTGRKYDRIICITSRFAKSKTRSDLEQELTQKYGLPITIHDRTWIVDQVVGGERKDIAYNYLHVGEPRSDPLRLGPADYSRLRQLNDIEKSLADPPEFEGMRVQRATEALLAAKLSRQLEQPRTEVDGRFMRAVRLANDGGTFIQKIEAQYELIATGFWYYDDVLLLDSAYDTFEALLGDNDDAQIVDFLCRLNQLLVNAAIYRLLPADQLRVKERTSRLELRLRKMTSDATRPNNQLEAETALLTIAVSRSLLAGEHDNLKVHWHAFAAVLERAKGLGEFDANHFAALIEAAGKVAKNDPAYTALIEKLSTFVAERTGEAEGALVLLRRAKALDDDPFEMIRLLGRAALGLTKKEHVDELIEAALLLGLAYHSAGLLWASRAACTFALANACIVGEVESDLPISMVHILKLTCWVDLELGHLPDFLMAIRLLKGVTETLQLTEDSKKLVAEDIADLDAALSSVMLNQPEDVLARLGTVPDITQALGLWLGRTGLLYRMGHQAVLRADNSLPPEDPDASVHEMLSRMASWPVGKSSRALIFNEPTPHTLETYLLGMRIYVFIDGSTVQRMLAEIALGALEAVFATVPEQHIIAHTEHFPIDIELDERVKKPSFTIDTLRVAGTLKWPAELDPALHGNQGEVQIILAEMALQVLGFTCFVADLDGLLGRLVQDEAVQQRIALVHVAQNSYHRIWHAHSTNLSKWDNLVTERYAPRLPLPKLSNIPPTQNRASPGDTPGEIRDHRAMGVRSVIDLHTWDRAGWRGLGYAWFPEDNNPPIMMVLFENETAGAAIFERWEQRVGKKDEKGEIRISIVRNLPGEAPHHYFAIFSAKEPERSVDPAIRLMAMANRSTFIDPPNDINLAGFLTQFAEYGVYHLCPAVYVDGGRPTLIKGRGFLKRDLVVRDHSELGSGDIDLTALRKGGPRK